MPINDTPQLPLNPYKSEVPIVSIPPQDLQPGGPLPQQAGYVGKTGAAASIGDNIFRGFLRGHEQLAQKKAQAANYAIDLAGKNEQSAWQTYQDTLRSGQAKAGDVNDPAYQAYLKAHQATSDTMEKVAIPDKKPKDGQGKKKKPEDDGQPKSFGQKLQDFMQANPHLIPQLAITSRVPNKPAMTAETEETKNTLAGQANSLTLQGQQIESNKAKAQKEQQDQQQAQLLQKVDSMGGIDAVAKSTTADPALVAVARQKVSERLDKEGPDGQLRDKFAQDVLNGNSKNWTPGDRQMAANLGYAAQPKEVKITGKNGHEMMQLVDPTTNQPISGSKPLDLGPPQWAQEFYGERAARKHDLEKSVQENPEQYGVTLTGDKKTDQARIEAASLRVFTDHEEGIKSAAGALNKTGYEIGRDNDILTDVSKELKSRIGGKAGDKANFNWPGESKPVTLSREDANSILSQFVTTPNGDHPGVYAFRSSPEIQQGKDAGAAERDRKWAYDLVKDRMMAAKGKKAMTAQQADAILSQTALGRPITPDEAPGPQKSGSEQGKGFFQKFWDAGPFGSGEASKPNGFPAPPQSSGATPGGKYYSVQGVDGPVQLSDEEVAKAKAANIPLEEVSSDLIQQFNQ